MAITKPSSDRVPQTDEATLEKMQNDEDDQNESVNCFVKILQMKVWEVMREHNSFIEESNLIHLIDRFASEEDIAECQ